MIRRSGLLALCAIAATAAMTWPDVTLARRPSMSGMADPLMLATGVGIDRSQIESGRAVLSVMPTEGRDLAVFGIVQTRAESSSLIAWSRAVEHLHKGRYMPAIGRFSTPPRLDDLAALALDGTELADLRKCRPGDCDIKLSAFEMGRISAAAARSGEDWESAVQRAFREVVLGRARDYLASGLGAAAPYVDGKRPVSPANEYSEVAARIGLEPLYGSKALAYFAAYPRPDSDDVESFLYWSKETLGGGKPIVSITHVAIFADPAAPTAYATVAARQVFASHYLTASLSFTIVAGGIDTDPQYLVYARRSRTDVFEGTFGWLIRSIVERRIRADGPDLLDGLRKKLEGSGLPTDSES